MKITLIIYLILLVIISGCTDNSTNSPTRSKEIIPLEIGNFWQYKVTLFYIDGYTLSAYVKDSVIKDTNLLSYTGFKLMHIYSDTLSYYYYAHTPQGVYYYDKESSYPGLFFKYPVTKGEKYVNLYGDTVRVEETGFKKWILSTEYTCYKYVIEHPELKFVYYCEPGIGCVCYEVYLLNPFTNEWFLRRLDEIFEYSN